MEEKRSQHLVTSQLVSFGLDDWLIVFRSQLVNELNQKSLVNFGGWLDDWMAVLENGCHSTRKSAVLTSMASSRICQIAMIDYQRVYPIKPRLNPYDGWNLCGGFLK